MNTTSILDNPATAKQECRPVQGEATSEIVDAVRSCLQVSLTGEAQNFRSWVAATHRKFNDLQRLGLATTAMTCLLSCGMLLASVWEARHITRQAEAQLQYFKTQTTAYPEGFAELTRANWEPTGKIITQKGRTFIELKEAK